MTDPSWTPLSRRTAADPAERPLVAGVPAHLAPPLKRWAATLLESSFGDPQLRETVQLHMGIALPQPDPWAGVLGGGPTGASLPDGEQLLDLVDAVLRWSGRRRDRQEWQAMTDHVEGILRTGRSVWRVNTARTGLEQRIDDTATAAVSRTLRTAGDEAAGHLATAWNAAYGRNPDPDKVYDEAVLAVEAVACPLVCPNNTRRTLGTVIRDLRNQTAQWELAIGDSTGQPARPGRLVEMLALLWEGQSRHAGSPNSRRQSQAEAEAAVHLAAALVQWLTAGVLLRTP